MPRAPRFSKRRIPAASADIPYDILDDVDAVAAITSECLDNASEWPLGPTISLEPQGVYVRAWVPHGKNVYVEVKKEGAAEGFDRAPLYQEGKGPYWGGLVTGTISVGSK
eukprot:3526089-Pyramimonas_sp.AAC.1